MGAYEDFDNLTEYPIRDLLNRPRREELVPDLCFKSGVTTLVGKSGKGKTTLTFSLGLAIDAAAQWAGQALGYPQAIPIVTGVRLDVLNSSNQTANDTAKKEDATRAEQDLVLMITVLRQFFGNRATNGDWQKHMEEFHGVG